MLFTRPALSGSKGLLDRLTEAPVAPVGRTVCIDALDAL